MIDGGRCASESAAAPGRDELSGTIGRIGGKAANGPCDHPRQVVALVFRCMVGEKKGATSTPVLQAAALIVPPGSLLHAPGPEAREVVSRQAVEPPSADRTTPCLDAR